MSQKKFPPSNYFYQVLHHSDKTWPIVPVSLASVPCEFPPQDCCPNIKWNLTHCRSLASSHPCTPCPAHTVHLWPP
jgi:hypothetical protein